MHDRIGAPTIAKLRTVLLSLALADAQQAAILDAWSAGSFVLASDEQWDSIRAVRDSVPKDWLK